VASRGGTLAGDELELLAHIDELEPELVELASRLVATRSVNPRYPAVDYEAEIGGEGDCTALIADALAASSVEVQRFAREPGRDNLCAVLRGVEGGPRVVLNGHVDTVAPGDLDAWRGDPWSGEVKDGRVWGLGAADMKGPIAAGVIAMRALAACGDSYPGELLLQCVVGEETSEAEKGALAALEEGFTGDAGICMEPTGQALADRHVLTLAPVAFGTLVLRFTVTGQAVHAGRRREVIYPTDGGRPGVSAWEKGLVVTDALARLEAAWAFGKRSPYYPAGQFILNPGVVSVRAKGADSAFFVPDEFVAEYVIFYSPHDPRAAVRAEIEGCINEAAERDEWLCEHPPRLEWLPSIPAADSGAEHPLFGITADAISAVTSEAPLVKGLTAGCDAAWMCEAGIPTLVYGPGDISDAHAPNESVAVDELVQAAKVYALAALRFAAKGI
jgi:acetylornithine deacetylase/succinyl-diaminopimelate desuccinylase-like protein